MSRNPQQPTALFLDFDGTIVSKDTAHIAMDRFGDPNWTRIDEALERGEVSFEESLRLEFAMLKVPKEVIIKEVSPGTSLRPNFDRLVDYCKNNNVSLKVVSGGLDFCIRHFLDRADWLKFIEIHAPKSQFTGNGYSLTFPRMFTSSSTNFKDDLVKHARKNGATVFFVGDGFGDFSAAKESDFAFAIKGSRLAELCREQRVPIQEMDDFNEVIDALNRRLRETK